MSADIAFDVWGCRGSRSIAPGRSRIGHFTSCYSIHCGEDLFVIDAGRGLSLCSDAVLSEPRFANVKRVHIFITHAHMDHWEGLKEAAWFWTPNNGLELTILGNDEALSTIKRCHEPPAYVPLEILALGSVASLTWREFQAGSSYTLHGHTFEGLKLHHYSGMGTGKFHLDTVGFRVHIANGPTLAYLSDHEPTEATHAMEDAAAEGAHLLVLDCQYADCKDHAFGHGSQEHAAQCAQRHPKVTVMCAHHGPRSDAELEAAYQRHSAGRPNLVLAIEGQRWAWDPSVAHMVQRP